MNEKSIIPGMLVLIIAAGAIMFVMSSSKTPTPSSSATSDTPPTEILGTSESNVVQLAQCIKDSGAVFYGAFWCSHCRQQKELFGEEGMAALAYVECSTEDGKNQTQVCIDKKIESYPTWEFKDGSRTTGVQTLTQLAEKTSCATPTASGDAAVPAL